MQADVDPAPQAARRPGRRALPVALVLLALALAGVAAERQARAAFLAEAARAGAATLRLAVATLQGQLDRFERLPPLVAENGLIRRLAEAPDEPAHVAAANLYLRDLARQLAATDIYFMDARGLTRAASNFDTETSFVGGNFAFRPYFTEAMAAGAGRYFALGTTSLKRGYYFGAPVRGPGGPLGVVVFKIDLDEIESSWQGGDYEVLVADPDGIVFLSSRADWRFRALRPLDPARLERLRETRRYVDRPLDPLPFSEGGTDPPRLTLAAAEGSRSFLALTEPMPAAGWEVTVLLPTLPVERQALTVALAVVLALGLGTMAVAVVLLRRARLRERLVLQQAAQAELEHRVAERTAELSALATRLEGEVAERRAAEEHLRQAQAGLVQAGKMAALGQMSAALSHEFNQPLAATRNFADNALVLLDRGRADEARGNIARILGMIDRMTAISRTLRSFARKPGQKLAAVDLAEAVAGATEIAGLALRTAGAELVVALPPGLPPVVAGPVRLQQVLVNLLTNAADAVEGAADRRIHLDAVATEGGVRITVRDHGPGVAPALAERIFDPFFSTKEVGKGLGLGLSISYNIVKDFGGTLSVAPAEGGGAVFTVDLRAAEAGSEAA
jgi:two-component system C4-dicarboxylate transport sensor histidine kinase DctB